VRYRLLGRWVEKRDRWVEEMVRDRETVVQWKVLFKVREFQCLHPNVQWKVRARERAFMARFSGSVYASSS